MSHFGPFLGDWGRTTTSKHALSPIPLKTWSLIYGNRDSKTAKSFHEILAGQAPKVGIKVSAPNSVALSNDKLEMFLKAIREQGDETQIVSAHLWIWSLVILF